MQKHHKQHVSGPSPSDSWVNWALPPVKSERFSATSIKACSAVMRGKLSKAENVFYSPHRTEDDDALKPHFCRVCLNQLLLWLLLWFSQADHTHNKSHWNIRYQWHSNPLNTTWTVLQFMTSCSISKWLNSAKWKCPCVTDSYKKVSPTLCIVLHCQNVLILNFLYSFSLFSACSQEVSVFLIMVINKSLKVGQEGH